MFSLQYDFYVWLCSPIQSTNNINYITCTSRLKRTTPIDRRDTPIPTSTSPKLHSARLHLLSLLLHVTAMGSALLYYNMNRARRSKTSPTGTSRPKLPQILLLTPSSLSATCTPCQPFDAVVCYYPRVSLRSPKVDWSWYYRRLMAIHSQWWRCRSLECRLFGHNAGGVGIRFSMKYSRNKTGRFLLSLFITHYFMSQIRRWSWSTIRNTKKLKWRQSCPIRSCLITTRTSKLLFLDTHTNSYLYLCLFAVRF